MQATRLSTHRHTHAARIDSKSCRASCHGLLTARRTPSICILREHTVIPHVCQRALRRTLRFWREREYERDGGVREGAEREREREEVQPAASKFGCNVTRPTSPDEVAVRAEIIRNNNTFLTSAPPPLTELQIPRSGRNVHHDAARSSRSVRSVYWARREHGTGRLRYAPVRPAARRAGRQGGSREQRWAGSHQAGRTRKLKAVV